MNHHQAVTRLFDYFYNKLYRTNYHLDLSRETQRKMVDNFVRLLGQQLNLPNVGVNHLVDYFAYNFHYWWSKKNLKRRITLGWIVGPVAYRRWVQRNVGVDFYTLQFLKEHSLDLQELRVELTGESSESERLSRSEELEKLRFVGEARFYHCALHTTLYHHLSSTCLGCTERVGCKTLLRNSNPKLYLTRGYGGSA